MQKYVVHVVMSPETTLTLPNSQEAHLVLTLAYESSEES